MYTKITDSISVTAEPAYLEDQSAPEENRYMWSYRIIIENNGAETVQLRSRYWRITDSLGMVQEVSGEGVVGEQPVLKPGERYEYTSGTPLNTPSGFMSGSYTMQRGDGRQFTIEIPAFSLDSPFQNRALH